MRAFLKSTCFMQMGSPVDFSIQPAGVEQM
jgi:hypothetical protein